MKENVKSIIKLIIGLVLNLQTFLMNGAFVGGILIVLLGVSVVTHTEPNPTPYPHWESLASRVLLDRSPLLLLDTLFFVLSIVFSVRMIKSMKYPKFDNKALLYTVILLCVSTFVLVGVSFGWFTLSLHIQ